MGDKNKILFKFLIILFLIFSSSQVKSAECNLPSNYSKKLALKKEFTTKEKKNVFVFFDGSQSMDGFVRSQSGIKNIFKELIDDLNQVAEIIGKTKYHRFGKKISPIDENQVIQVTKPTFYNCAKNVSDCALDNQETRLDLAFKAAQSSKESTTIIVTDLFISSKHLVGSRRATIVNPLKQILKDGKSIGLLGIMSSFKGTIYDIPKKDGSEITYSGAKRRPFYIIIIGSDDNIIKIKNKLFDLSLKNIDKKDIKFSIITSNLVSNSLNQIDFFKKENFTASTLKEVTLKKDDGIPTYSFDISRKAKSINFNSSIDKFLIESSNGISEYKIEERIWSTKDTKSCKDWVEFKSRDFSNVNVSNNNLKISIFGKEKKNLNTLFYGRKYFSTIDVIAFKPGIENENIFSDWDVEEQSIEDFKNKEPADFKTLNLKKMIRVLNSVAEDEFKPITIASVNLLFNLEK